VSSFPTFHYPSILIYINFSWLRQHKRRCPKIEIDSIQFPLSLDACLPVGRRERVRVRVHCHLFYPLPPGEGSFWGLSFSISIFGKMVGKRREKI
jgi:hypothetical protein